MLSQRYDLIQNNLISNLEQLPVHSSELECIKITIPWLKIGVKFGRFHVPDGMRN